MRKKAEEGLTLLEAILGISISAVILIILLSALRLGHRSQEKGMEREEVSQRMRILADRVSWLLRGAYPYTVGTPDGKVLYFSGALQSVGFVTTSVDGYSGELEDISGLKWVTLSVDSGEGLKTREKIYFLDDVFEESGGKEYVLDPWVASIEFEYLEIDESKSTEEWLTEWNPMEKDHLPYAVRASIVLDCDGKEIRMPPVIAAIRSGRAINSKKSFQ